MKDSDSRKKAQWKTRIHKRKPNELLGFTEESPMNDSDSRKKAQWTIRIHGRKPNELFGFTEESPMNDSDSRKKAQWTIRIHGRKKKKRRRKPNGLCFWLNIFKEESQFSHLKPPASPATAAPPSPPAPSSSPASPCSAGDWPRPRSDKTPWWGPNWSTETDDGPRGAAWKSAPPPGAPPSSGTWRWSRWPAVCGTRSAGPRSQSWPSAPWAVDSAAEDSPSSSPDARRPHRQRRRPFGAPHTECPARNAAWSSSPPPRAASDRRTSSSSSSRRDRVASSRRPVHRRRTRSTRTNWPTESRGIPRKFCWHPDRRWTTADRPWRMRECRFVSGDRPRRPLSLACAARIGPTSSTCSSTR